MSDDPNQPSDAPGGRPPWEPRPATSDQPWPSSPPTTGTPPPGPAGTPGTDPTVPGPVAPAPGAPATAGDDEGPAGARPRPALWSLVAAAGGLLAALGLVALLSEPDIADERALVVAVSAIFEVLGIVLVVLARDRRAAAGGVALSLLAALPLVNALVVDPNDLFGAFDDLDSLRNQQLTILGLLAIIWLALYAFGPARRYGALLGGALLAIWSIPMTWFSFEAVDDLFSAFGGFDPFGSSLFGDPFASDPFSDVGSSTGNLALKLGITSLLFGAGYLAAAGWLDRQGQSRMATPFFAVAPYASITALAYLSEDFGVWGTAAVGLALGAAAIWLGATAGRRFTAWIGVASVVGAVLSVVGDTFEDSPTGAGITLALIGVAAVVGATLLEARSDA